MAFLKDTFGSIKNLFEKGNVKEAQKKMMEAVNNMTADDNVTPEELAEMNRLQTELGISNEDMADIKLKVLENMIDKISKDGNISPEEITVFNQLKESLGVDMKLDLDSNSDKEFVKEKMGEMKNFLVGVKNKGLTLGGKFLDKTKVAAKDLFNKENTQHDADLTEPKKPE